MVGEETVDWEEADSAQKAAEHTHGASDRMHVPPPQELQERGNQTTGWFGNEAWETSVGEQTWVFRAC